MCSPGRLGHRSRASRHPTTDEELSPVDPTPPVAFSASNQMSAAATSTISTAGKKTAASGFKKSKKLTGDDATSILRKLRGSNFRQITICRQTLPLNLGI